MKVERPHEGLIIFRASQKASFIVGSVLLVGLLVAYWFVLVKPKNMSDILELARGEFALPFYVISGLFFLAMLLVLRIIGIGIVGRVIAFDEQSRTITLNKRVLARFDDVKHLDFQIDTSDVSLTILLTSDKRVEAGSLCHPSQFEGLQAEIEKLLNLPKPLARQPEETPIKERMFFLAHRTLLVISLLMILGSIAMFTVSMGYFVKGISTVGTVIKAEAHWGGRLDEETEHKQTIEFRDKNGERHEFKTSVLDASDAHVGKEVPIIYLPDNPNRVRIKTFGQLWGASYMLLFFGVAFYGACRLLKYLESIPFR